MSSVNFGRNPFWDIRVLVPYLGKYGNGEARKSSAIKFSIKPHMKEKLRQFMEKTHLGGESIADDPRTGRPADATYPDSRS